LVVPLASGRADFQPSRLGREASHGEGVAHPRRPPITLARTLKANLNVQAVDLEATKMLLDSMFSLELSGGVRYGRTKVEASLTRQELFGDTVLSTNSFVGRTTFEGVGPTVSTEACHRLGGTPFNFLGNIRGSLLFGQSNSYNEEIGGVPGKKINHGDADVVPVIEVQMGAEYVKMIGNGRLSLRALMEGQWWGVATPGAGFARDLENAPISGGVDLFTTGRDIGFFGVTAGIIYEH
ncbi:MAG: Lpg1974 family pore-forming outer membrane protein, partial [Planctomycetes bacterium]|nr:Lpg1974 family pore-forming outer membrane protein [Planctomycetota bacterium]